MSSVTKNPTILQSANYVYSWFLSLPEKNKKFIEKAQLLDEIKSDEIVIHNAKNSLLKENNRADYEKRLDELENKIFNYDYGDKNDK